MSDWRRPSSTPERLKIALSQSKMKQIDLSNLTGIDKGSISNYLSGRYEPKSDAINKMAIALNVSEMWLWGYDVPMEREEKKISPEDPQLNEGEKVLIDLFRRVPEDQQKLVLQMIRVALGNQE